MVVANQKLNFIKIFRIEWAASAMEMSVLSASNVANLIKVNKL